MLWPRTPQEPPVFDTTIDPYVALAHLSYETYVITGRRAAMPEGLPKEMLDRKAGAFVSLHMESGELRGCIGTLAPAFGCIAEEILQNAVSAATRDPRFPPVRPAELPHIVCNVDVLGESEPCQMEDLDPKRYGVIVSCGYRRGVLLPDLEGVDTKEFQVDIARQKAGIGLDEHFDLERFEVVRHEA